MSQADSHVLDSREAVGVVHEDVKHLMDAEGPKDLIEQMVEA